MAKERKGCSGRRQCSQGSKRPLEEWDTRQARPEAHKEHSIILAGQKIACRQEQQQESGRSSELLMGRNTGPGLEQQVLS